jgi:hypothetical protein
MLCLKIESSLLFDESKFKILKKVTHKLLRSKRFLCFPVGKRSEIGVVCKIETIRIMQFVQVQEEYQSLKKNGDFSTFRRIKK